LSAASVASAAFHLFRIEQIYSNADGTVQFVVLHETTFSNSEHQWSTQSLISSGPGPQKTYVFPDNLPSPQTSNRRVLVATEGFAALSLVTRTISSRWLSADSQRNGQFRGVSQVTYTRLPTDGTNAMNATGA
jgi:hypothetical protein